MDLQVASIDAVVVSDHHLGELDVLVVERLQYSVELLDDQVQAAEGVALELLQLLLEVRPSLLGAGGGRGRRRWGRRARLGPPRR